MQADREAEKRNLDQRLRTEVPLKGAPAKPGDPNTALANTHQTSPEGNEAAAPRFANLGIVEKTIKEGKVFGGKHSTTDKASIIALQELLHATRFGSNIQITGVMDAETTKAIKSLQYAYGARGKENDGIAGKQTLTWLQQEYSLHLEREQAPKPAAPVMQVPSEKPAIPSNQQRDLCAISDNLKALGVLPTDCDRRGSEPNVGGNTEVGGGGGRGLR